MWLGNPVKMKATKNSKAIDPTDPDNTIIVHARILIGVIEWVLLAFDCSFFILVSIVNSFDLQNGTDA